MWRPSAKKWVSFLIIIILKKIQCDKTTFAGIQAYDIVSTLQYLGMIKYWRGKHVILRKEDVIADYMGRVRSRPRDKVTMVWNVNQNLAKILWVDHFGVFISLYCLVGNIPRTPEVEALRADSKGETASWADQEEARRKAERQIGLFLTFKTFPVLMCWTSGKAVEGQMSRKDTQEFPQSVCLNRPSGSNWIWQRFWDLKTLVPWSGNTHYSKSNTKNANWL